MSLRQLQRKGRSLLRDGGLVQALQSELNHELSSSPPNPSQSHQDGDLRDFTLDWDDPRTQDVVLRRRHGGSNEEIAVSALLAPLIYKGEDLLPRHALMKVCVKKPGSDPILQFDCRVFRRPGDEEEGGSGFTVQNAYFQRSPTSSVAPKCRGPRFSSLNSQLRGALKEYLISRGIGVELTNFLLQHLYKKEQGQYVNWLHSLKGIVTKDE